MADPGSTILNLPATVALGDTDVLPLARPSGTTAPGTDLGLSGAALKAIIAALAAKGGLFRGAWAANTVYRQYDSTFIPAGNPNAGLLAFATVAFTSPAAYVAANWTLEPGQSTNDYTSPEKAKLAGLSTPVAATATTAGIARLYAATGTATDGAMTQAAITAGLFFDFTNEVFTSGAGPIPLAARASTIVSGNNTAVTYNLPPAASATYLAFRLQAVPFENVPLAMVFSGGTLDNLTTLSIQPGEFRIIAKPAGSTAWNTVWAARNTVQATATTLGTVRGGGTGNVNINADGSMTATAFTPITQNQYGTHPAFSAQFALNAYLLGGAATVPTTSTPTFTAA